MNGCAALAGFVTALALMLSCSNAASDVGASPGSCDVSGASSPGYYPSFPQRLSARITVDYHKVAADAEYPPRQKVMDVVYDRAQKVARVDVKGGHDANKTFIALYGDKVEYMMRHGEFAACETSYLSEPFPEPSFPQGFRFVGKKSVAGSERLLDEWSSAGDSVELLYDREGGVPVRLVAKSEDGSRIVTYTLEPKKYDTTVAPPEQRDDCTRRVGGFPTTRLPYLPSLVVYT